MTAPQMNVINLDYRRQLSNFTAFAEIERHRIRIAKIKLAAGMIDAAACNDLIKGAALALRFIARQIEDLRARQ